MVKSANPYHVGYDQSDEPRLGEDLKLHNDARLTGTYLVKQVSNYCSMIVQRNVSFFLATQTCAIDTCPMNEGLVVGGGVRYSLIMH